MDSWEKKLQKAVEKNKLESVKKILKKRKASDLLGRNKWPTWEVYPLHYAACLGYNDMIQALIEAGLDVNSYWCPENNYRTTSLHRAVSSERNATVRLLLDLGADPSLQGQWDDESLGSPLEFARRRKITDIVRILEAHDAARATLQKKIMTTVPPGQPRKAKAPTIPFASLDSLAKLKQKSAKVKELDEAYLIQSDIKNQKVQVKTLEEKIEKEKEELRKDEMKLVTLKENLKYLERKPSLKNMEETKKHLAEIEAIEESLKDVMREEARKEECSVCLVLPGQIFTCKECDNWVCQECKGRVATCPSCRQDLTVKPLRRNKALERHMGIG